MTPHEFCAELRRIARETLAEPNVREVWRLRREAILRAVTGLTDLELDAVINMRLDAVGVPKAVFRAAGECLLREREGRVMGWRHEPRQRTVWDWVTQ